MKTGELIAALAADLDSGRPCLACRTLQASGLAALVAGAFFFVFLGPRTDFLFALSSWRFLVKFALTGSLACTAGFAALRLARPDATARSLLFLAIPALILLAALVAEAGTISSAEWGSRTFGRNWAVCLAAIPSLSLAPLAILLWALQAGAPRSPAVEGALAGLLAGALAATFYAAHCTDDSPFFVATWYSLALVAPVTLGACAGARLLRW